jgi:pimeloyl-ACP methyl ester carboxylesterase
MLGGSRHVIVASMTAQLEATTREQHVHANGIDVHYVEAGVGEPLILLYNGMISTSAVWTDWPSSYSRYVTTLARHFRVIAPDFRGSGKTVHPGGPIPYDLLADDVVALIDALDLDRPFVAGYGDGGHVATIVGIREPDAVRAIVNHGGFDLFNPDPLTPSLVMTRQMLGGSSDAERADPDLVAESEHPFLRTMVELMRADHDVAQGTDHWKSVLALNFDRFSHPAGYTWDDLNRITAPTLVIVGDRDPFEPVEEATTTYRALPEGELAILPNTAVGITHIAVKAMIEFLSRKFGTVSHV